MKKASKVWSLSLLHPNSYQRTVGSRSSLLSHPASTTALATMTFACNKYKSKRFTLEQRWGVSHTSALLALNDVDMCTCGAPLTYFPSRSLLIQTPPGIFFGRFLWCQRAGATRFTVFSPFRGRKVFYSLDRFSQVFFDNHCTIGKRSALYWQVRNYSYNRCDLRKIKRRHFLTLFYRTRLYVTRLRQSS